MVRWVVVRVVLGFTITTVLTACGSGNVLESEAGGPPSFDPMATVSFAAPVRDVTMGVDDQHLTAVITTSRRAATRRAGTSSIPASTSRPPTSSA